MTKENQTTDIRVALKNKIRRSSLYIPGNKPEMIKKSKTYEPDVVILDLEDAVPPQEKNQAREIVREILLTMEFGPIERTVRINPIGTPEGEEDLKAILAAKPDCVRIPKTETAQEIIGLDRRMNEIEEMSGLPAGGIPIIPILETAMGVWNGYKILSSCQRVIGVTFGTEDFVRDMGMPSRDTTVLSWIRILVKLQAAAAKVAAFDGSYSNFKNPEALRAEASIARSWGYEGKSVIHPKQIPIVNEVFSPTPEEIEYALRVSNAFTNVMETGGGVANLDGKMIDKPIYERAQRVLESARLLHLL